MRVEFIDRDFEVKCHHCGKETRPLYKQDDHYFCCRSCVCKHNGLRVDNPDYTPRCQTCGKLCMMWHNENITDDNEEIHYCSMGCAAKNGSMSEVISCEVKTVDDNKADKDMCNNCKDCKCNKEVLKNYWVSDAHWDGDELEVILSPVPRPKYIIRTSDKDSVKELLNIMSDKQTPVRDFSVNDSSLEVDSIVIKVNSIQNRGK